MKGSKLLLLLLLASSLYLSAVIAAQETCPADFDSKCEGGASDDWEGEFFPGIPKIKYEGPKSKNPLAYKWYNAEEVILGKKMKETNANLDEIVELAKQLQATFLQAAVDYKKKIGFNGWDTDQFMTDIAEATLGGLAPGGFNFDAKLRRESTDVEDMFLAHISGMDTLARGLRNVDKLIEDGSLDELVRRRYQSFDSEIGALIEAGKGDFETLERKVLEWGEPTVPSGKQELAEMLFQSAL
nr:unnamed protein product [Digitaria exilis]